MRAFLRPSPWAPAAAVAVAIAAALSAAPPAAPARAAPAPRAVFVFGGFTRSSSTRR
jgi:hypothetical protein